MPPVWILPVSAFGELREINDKRNPPVSGGLIGRYNWPKGINQYIKALLDEQRRSSRTNKDKLGKWQKLAYDNPTLPWVCLNQVIMAKPSSTLPYQRQNRYNYDLFGNFENELSLDCI